MVLVLSFSLFMIGGGGRWLGVRVVGERLGVEIKLLGIWFFMVIFRLIWSLGLEFRK